MIRAYLVTGFLESGKTTYLNEHLLPMCAGEKAAVICCEEGEAEYEPEEGADASVIPVEQEEDFSAGFLRQIAEAEKPEYMFVEWNGMWDPKNALAAIEEAGIDLIRTDAVIDATTFTLYFSNMGSWMLRILRSADEVHFNRVTTELEAILRGRRLRLYNKEAAITLEYTDGSKKDYETLDVCPVDLDEDVIRIRDDIFALWYIDALDHPSRYEGKRVELCLMMRRSPKFPDTDIPGRFAIVCCEKDMQFFGLAARGEALRDFQNRNWIRVTATVRVEEQKLYQGKGPVLLVEEAVPCPEPTMEFVGF